MNEEEWTADDQAFLDWLARVVRSDAFRNHPQFWPFKRRVRSVKYLEIRLKGRQN